MANKIAQITVGDLKVIHLDDDPSTTGYSANQGSVAIWKRDPLPPFVFLKQIQGNDLAWTRIPTLDMVHSLMGNINSSALALILGSLTTSANLDLDIVRNSIPQIQLVEDVEAGFRPSKISLLQGLEIREHIVNDAEVLGLSYSIESAKGLVISGQKTVIDGIDFMAIGVFSLISGYTDSYAYELRKAKSIKATFPLASHIIPTVTMETDVLYGEIKKLRVTIVGRHESDKENTNFMFIKELAVKMDTSNEHHTVLFQQDVMTYNQDSLPRNFAMQFDVGTQQTLEAVMTGHNQALATEIQFYVEEVAFELES